MPAPNGSTRTAFLDMPSFSVEEAVASHPPAASLPSQAAGASPFLSIYDSEEPGDTVNQMAEEYLTFFNELYDEEFDDALFELVNEAAALRDEQFTTSSLTTRALSTERLLKEHFEPLGDELESALDHLAQHFGNTDAASLSESEIDAAVDGLTPGVELSPTFENIFGFVKDAVKKVAGKAVDLAKKGVNVARKLALGPIFLQLKRLVKPLLERVLQSAIGKLPAAVQPIARRLAARFGLRKQELEALEIEDEESADDASYIQREFNENLANLLFAGDDVDRDLAVSRALSRTREPSAYSLDELDLARDQFIDGLNQLKEGEDPGPLIERFIPALLPILKTAVHIIGRPRVVSFLASLLAKLVRRFVGPGNAKKLSEAIVDVGLGVLQLEMTPEDEKRTAASAVVGTVEDVVSRVAAFPEYIIDDQELLEAFTLEAFEEAASANFPPLLSEETYMDRPELRETKSVQGAWVMMPLRGKKRYKKFCRVLRTRISPHKARAVESFDGAPLSDYLEDQLGLPPGGEYEAEVHLYESIAGTTLPDIARLESNTPGLGSNSEEAYGQMHPLTTEAAATLLGEPGLGHDMEWEQIPDRRRIRPRQRFYRLRIPGARPVKTRVRRRLTRLRRLAGLRVILDFRSRHIRIPIYFSEVRAQAIAVKLRRKAHTAATMAVFRRIVDSGLLHALGRGTRGRLRIIQEAVTPEEALGGAVKRIPPAILNRLRGLLRQWLLKAWVEFVKGRAQEFITAAEAPEDGVTLIATIVTPAGWDVLRQAVRGQNRALAGLKLVSSPPTVNIKVVPGYSHG